jgi:[ribosomal protein S5]-alanine N-acetyltransferase
MSFPVLETERLNLIEIKEEHVKEIYDIFSREEVTRFYGLLPFKKEDQAIKMVESFSKNFQDNRAVRWGIVLKETGEFIGSVGLNNLQLWSKRSEIGYELRPDVWGKGIASEAVKTVLSYSFQELELFRIGAVTFPENFASSKLLLNLGFQKEGLLRGYIYQGGTSYDTFVYSLLKSDWEREM